MLAGGDAGASGGGAMTLGYKLFAHDYRSPLQGGAPAWDGTYPFELPHRSLDRSDAECAAGWNFCRDIATAARIAGLWKDGRPRHVVKVETVGDWVERGDKLRADSLRILVSATEQTMARHLGRPFGEHAARMGRSQVAWWKALHRPYRDEARVEKGLREALAARELDWELRRVRAASTAWDVWDAWAAWDAWDAWDARAALTIEYAALEGWTNQSPDLLTTGIRDAYANGLALAALTAPNELSWAMEPGAT